MGCGIGDDWGESGYIFSLESAQNYLYGSATLLINIRRPFVCAAVPGCYLIILFWPGGIWNDEYGGDIKCWVDPCNGFYFFEMKEMKNNKYFRLLVILQNYLSSLGIGTAPRTAALIAESVKGSSR